MYSILLRLQMLVFSFALAAAVQLRSIASSSFHSIIAASEIQEAIDSNERTHLLVDPVINNTSIQRVHSDDYLPCDSSLPKKTDEQSALNRILQETATNVIDVAALGSHNLEQHEYLERTNYYTAKLSTLAKWSFLKNPPSLLVDIPVPEKVLSASPISSLDLDLMNIAVEKAVNALLDLKLEPGEDLVVPFRIP